MTVSRFDRVRPRTASAESPQAHDAEGKRALFSSTEGARPTGGGSILIECSRCGNVTGLTPTAALRAIFPAVHTSVTVARGDRERTLGLLRRRYGSWLRCPACGHGSWTRVTVRI